MTKIFEDFDKYELIRRILDQPEDIDLKYNMELIKKVIEL